ADRLERVLRGLARGDRLGFGLGLGEDLPGALRPALREGARHAALEFARELGMRLGVAREALRPPLLERRAARAGVPAFVDSPRDLERCVRPAERRASRSHLFGPERRAVRVVGT